MIRVLLLAALGGLLPAVSGSPVQSEAYNAFYNLDYDRALALFERETTQAPAKPGGLEPSRPRPAPPPSFPRRRHVLRPRLQQRIPPQAPQTRDAPGRGEALSSRPSSGPWPLPGSVLKVRKDDPTALCMPSASPTPTARKYHLLVRKANFDALRDGNRSRSQHNRLRQIDPEPPGRPPDSRHARVHRQQTLAACPIHGRDGGLLRQPRARRSDCSKSRSAAGRRPASKPGSLLALTFHREKQPDRALPLIRELSNRFPPQLPLPG
jgi:hypothetical protein